LTFPFLFAGESQKVLEPTVKVHFLPACPSFPCNHFLCTVLCRLADKVSLWPQQVRDPPQWPISFMGLSYPCRNRFFTRLSNTRAGSRRFSSPPLNFCPPSLKEQGLFSILHATVLLSLCDLVAPMGLSFVLLQLPPSGPSLPRLPYFTFLVGPVFSPLIAPFGSLWPLCRFCFLPPLITFRPNFFC